MCPLPCSRTAVASCHAPGPRQPCCHVPRSPSVAGIVAAHSVHTDGCTSYTLITRLRTKTLITKYKKKNTKMWKASAALQKLGRNLTRCHFAISCEDRLLFLLQLNQPKAPCMCSLLDMYTSTSCSFIWVHSSMSRDWASKISIQFLVPKAGQKGKSAFFVKCPNNNLAAVNSSRGNLFVNTQGKITCFIYSFPQRKLSVLVFVSITTNANNFLLQSLALTNRWT